MRFTIEQHIDAPAAAAAAALADPDLYPTFAGLTKVATPEVLSCQRDGDQVDLRLQMRFIAPLSSAARRVIDPDRITWVQVERYDLAALTASVRFEPDNYADRFSCVGNYAFGDDPAGGSTMSSRGELKIRMPLVGGKVEQAMVSGLREHFAEQAPLVAAWVASRG